MAYKPRARSFLFCAESYLHDERVLRMSLEERGAYSTLLFNAWLMERPGEVPDSDQAVANLARCSTSEWERVKGSVLACFRHDIRRRVYVQGKMVKTYRAQTRFLERQRERGKRGAKALWDKEKDGTSITSGPACAMAVLGSRFSVLGSPMNLEEADSPASQSLSPDSSPKPSVGNQDKIVRASRSTFTRPTPDELAAYCAERRAAGRPAVDPEAWLDHYVANGWRVGRSPMRDWKAALRQWERNGFAAQHQRKPGYNAKGGLTAEAILAFGKKLKREELENEQG